MKLFPMIIIGCTLAIPASGAWAKDKARPVDAETLRVMHDFGRCVGKWQSSGKLLGTVPYSKEEAAVAGRISTSGCLHDATKLRFRALLLRGLVAEQLYLGSLENRSRHDWWPVFAMPVSSTSTPMTNQQLEAIAMIGFGQCVASIDKAGVSALFKTAATSDDERKAYTSLQPAMAQCVEKGASFHMNPFTLRGFLAEGAYRNEVEKAQQSHA